MWISRRRSRTWRVFALMLLFVGRCISASSGPKLATDIADGGGDDSGRPRWCCRIGVARSDEAAQVGRRGAAFAGGVDEFRPAVFEQAGRFFVMWPRSATGTARCWCGHGRRRRSWAMQAWLALATAPTMSLSSLVFEAAKSKPPSTRPGMRGRAYFGAIDRRSSPTPSCSAGASTSRAPRPVMTPVFSFVLAVLMLDSRIAANPAGRADDRRGGAGGAGGRRFKAVA